MLLTSVHVRVPETAPTFVLIVYTHACQHVRFFYANASHAGVRRECESVRPCTFERLEPNGFNRLAL